MGLLVVVSENTMFPMQEEDNNSTSTKVDLIGGECWSVILRYCDVKTCIRLSGCNRHMAAVVSDVWWDKCDELYGVWFRYTTSTNVKILLRTEPPKELVKRMFVLKAYALQQEGVLRRHWCYPSLATLPFTSPIDIQSSHDFFSDSHLYDFYVRFRVRNGAEVHENFYPAGSTIISALKHEIYFPIQDGASVWRGLNQAQEYVGRFARNSTIADDDIAMRTLSAVAWDCTSALVVGTRVRCDHGPCVVAAGFSFPAFGDSDSGEILGMLSMDYSSRGNNMQVSDHFWFFRYSERCYLQAGEDFDYTIGFVTDATKLKWLVLSTPVD